MREYPMTIGDFVDNFATEDQCRRYVWQLRYPSGFVCPKCGGNKAWSIRETLFECSTCKLQLSITSGTIFQDTRKPLKMWFAAIWWVTTQKTGASAMNLQQVLGLKSYTTAWTWLHKIRTAMVDPNRKKLSGRVEVDETYVGGVENDGKRGRGTSNKTLVAVAIELKDKGKLGRLRLSVVEDASKESLLGFVKENIEIGSTVVTDGWSSYLSLPKIGFKHEIVYPFDENDGEENLLPHVHTIISLLKRWLLGARDKSPDGIVEYMRAGTTQVAHVC